MPLLWILAHDELIFYQNKSPSLQAMGRQPINLQVHIQDHYLEALWTEIQQQILRATPFCPALKQFNAPVLLFNGYNLKMRVRRESIMEVHQMWQDYLAVNYHMRWLDKREQWVDLVCETTPDAGAVTFFHQD